MIGVDLGQAHDPTAIAVLERKETAGGWDAVACTYRKAAELRLRYLERMELVTSYVDVVSRVVKIARSSELAERCRIVVDGTGAGRPVVDLLRAARPGCWIIPVMVTGGAAETSVGGYYGVPKVDLISGLQVMLQNGDLQVAAGVPFAGELMKEMSAMRVKVTPSGREQYGAWREGEHDDLVFAVALTCWAARRFWAQRTQSHWTNETGDAALGLLLRGM